MTTNSLVPKPFDITDGSRARQEQARLAERRDGASWAGNEAVAKTVTKEVQTREELAETVEAEAQAARDAIVAEATARAEAFIDVDAALTDLDTRYNGVITEAGQLGAKLDQAELDITAAEGRLDEAASNITEAFGQIGVVDAKATTATTAASTAQNKADTAKSVADQAAADALAAAGLAGSKGEIIYQASAPTGTRANPANLWVRSSDNKPHTYDASTSKWVARTDKAATDAAAVAAAAAGAAATAQSTANEAQAAAGTAQSTADGALTMAGSKSRVYYSTAVATGTGAGAGDLWRQRNAGNEIVAEWQWSGSGWVKQTVSGSNVSNMDIGFLTAGAAVMSIALINKLVAGTANFQTVDVNNLFATTGTMSEAVIAKLWADVVMSRKITTQMLAVGDFTNLAPSMADGGAQWIGGGRGIRVNASVRDGWYWLRYPSLGNDEEIMAANNASCRPGEKFYTNFYYAVTGALASNTTLQVFLEFTNSSGAVISREYAHNTNAVSSYRYLDGTIVTAPAGAAKVRVGVKMIDPTAGTPAGLAAIGDINVRRMNAGELTVDGTVTARQFESELVLATKIIAGDPASTHAEMSPLGFKVFAAPLGGGTPTEVVRMGVANTDDYFAISRADGTLAATISQDGVISGEQVNISGGMYYQGEELTRILDRLPKGLVGWAQRNDSSTVPAGNSERLPYLRLTINAQRGRSYKVSTSPISSRSASGGSGAAAVVRLNYEQNGAVATAFSGTLATGVAPKEGLPNSWDGAPLILTGMINAKTDGIISAIISFQATGTGTVNLVASPSSPGAMYIEDIGPTVYQTGEVLNGTSAPPPSVQNYYREYRLTGASSYQGNGSYYAYSENKMFQGQSPGGSGNLTSIVCFQSMTGDLAGATITGMRVYLYFEFWYYNAGGTAYLGLHGHATPPSTFSHSVSGFTASGNWPRPGGRWVDIPSTYWAGFKSGAYKGVSLQAPNGMEYYGYATENALISVSYNK